MAGSKPSLMVAIMPTALFFTADATPASCRVIGWVLNPWGHQLMCTHLFMAHLTKIVGDLVAKLHSLRAVGSSDISYLKPAFILA